MVHLLSFCITMFFVVILVLWAAILKIISDRNIASPRLLETLVIQHIIMSILTIICAVASFTTGSFYPILLVWAAAFCLVSFIGIIWASYNFSVWIIDKIVPKSFGNKK